MKQEKKKCNHCGKATNKIYDDMLCSKCHASVCVDCGEVAELSDGLCLNCISEWEEENE